MPVHVLPTLASRRGLGRRSSAQPGSDSDGDSSIHKRSASDMHDSISSQSMSGAKFFEMTQKAARQASSHLELLVSCARHPAALQDLKSQR